MPKQKFSPDTSNSQPQSDGQSSYSQHKVDPNKFKRKANPTLGRWNGGGVYDDPGFSGGTTAQKAHNQYGGTPSQESPGEEESDSGANDLAQREQAAGNQQASGGAQGGGSGRSTSKDLRKKEQAGDEEPSFYKPEEKGGAHRKRKGLFKGRGGKTKKKHRTRKARLLLALGGLLGGLGLVFLIAILLLLVAPAKHIHFATVLRTVAFARYTYQMNRQWSRVIFDASVLTDRGTGSFPKGSLVNRLPGINPERQLAQLGRDGTIQWDFQEQRRWGGVLSSRNVYKGVVIDGERIDLDGTSKDLFTKTNGNLTTEQRVLANIYSQRLFGKNYSALNAEEREAVKNVNSQTKDALGKNYSDLSRREGMTVRARHANAYRAAIGDALATVPRSQYWAAYRGFHQATGIRLYGWLNKAREWVGKSPKEAKALTVEKNIERSGVSSPIKTGLTAIDEESEQAQKDNLDAAKEGRPTPGAVRTKLAARLRTATNVSDAVLVATLSCLIWHFDKAFDAAKAEREAKIAKTGNLTLSKADQTQAGDSVAEATNAENFLWDGAEQAALYRQSIGRPLALEDVEQLETIPWVEPQKAFANVVGTVSDVMKWGLRITNPAIGVADLFTGGETSDEAITDTCNILLNEYLQWAITAVELGVSIATLGTAKGILAAIRGGIQLAVGVVAGIAIADWVGNQVDNMVKQLSNLDYTGVNEGANKFNENAVSLDYTSQSGNRTITFGRPLNQDEADASQEVAMDAVRGEYEDKSFTNRYFAISNPFSLFGQFVAVTPTSASGVASSMQQGVASIGSTLTSPVRLFGGVTNMFTSGNVAKAAQVTHPGTNYGVDQWGWTTQENERIDNDENFLMPEGSCSDNPNNFVCRVESNIDELNDRYWKCYDPDEWQLQADKPEECTREYLASDDALYWRYYMSYLYATGRLTGSV